jgi:hypothetical protein
VISIMELCYFQSAQETAILIQRNWEDIQGGIKEAEASKIVNSSTVVG